MKRSYVMVFLTVITVIFSSGKVHAQEWELGVKGGLNISKVAVKNFTTLGSKLGFHVGGYAGTYISDELELQPEVHFSSHGWKNAQDEFITVNYVNVPVMAKYYLDEQFNVQAGPQAGFLISAEGDRESIFRSFDLSISVGADYTILDNLDAGIRYNVGLLDLFADSNNPIDYRNRVFQIFASYRLSQTSFAGKR